VINAEEKERSSTRRTNVRLAMERKFSKRRR
jgi:hypothetical protein